MYDYLVKNGLVVNSWGSSVSDVAISGSQVAAVGTPGAFDAIGAAEIIDATDQIVVPGGIDPHCHTGHLVPTAAEEGLVSAGAREVSMAAAHGGTTTLVDFAIWRPGESLAETIERKAQEFTSSYTDYALHVAFQGAIDFDIMEQVPDIIRDGHVSVKIWTTNATPSRPRQMTTAGYMWGLLEVIQEAGGILAVHGEDDEIVMYSYDKLRREGRTGFENIHLAHPTLSEALSFRRVINLVERVGGAVYMVHVSAAEGVNAIAEARAKGLAVYGETLQHYLTFTAERYGDEGGALFHTYPSLKYDEDIVSMWNGLESGTLSTVATDEMCTSRAVKERGRTIDDITGGHVGVEVRMPVFFTEAVAKRGFSLERFVEITSTNAAKILGMYPRKGVIAQGADADLVLLDPQAGRDISSTELHESDYTPWEGWHVEAWPVTTFIRGALVIRNGVMVGKPGWGELIERKIEPGVLNGPAC